MFENLHHLEKGAINVIDILIGYNTTYNSLASHEYYYFVSCSYDR